MHGSCIKVIFNTVKKYRDAKAKVISILHSSVSPYILGEMIKAKSDDPVVLAPQCREEICYEELSDRTTQSGPVKLNHGYAHGCSLKVVWLAGVDLPSVSQQATCYLSNTICTLADNGDGSFNYKAILNMRSNKAR